MLVGLRLISVHSTCRLQGIVIREELDPYNTVFIIRWTTDYQRPWTTRWFQNDFSLEMESWTVIYPSPVMDLLYEEED